MPDRESPETNKEETLRWGLERVRLMFLAEEDGERIRTTWAALDIDDVADERLARDIKEMQGRIDRLPAAVPLEETT
jgi:hypothetical protein